LHGEAVRGIFPVDQQVKKELLAYIRRDAIMDSRKMKQAKPGVPPPTESAAEPGMQPHGASPTLGNQSRSHMPPEIWIQILVVVIILGGLGWLLIQVFEIKGTVGSVDQRVDDTRQRLDRIAQALPDLRVRVAKDEVSRPVETAVVSTKAFQLQSGKWFSAVYVLDTSQLKRFVYLVKSNGPDDKTLQDIVAGSVAQADNSAVSFAQLESFSSVVGKPVYVPLYVEKKASFVLRMSAKDYIPELSVLGVKPQEQPLPSKFGSWDNLVSVLDSNAKDYQPK
jgi:hypothetical protein